MSKHPWYLTSCFSQLLTWLLLKDVTVERKLGRMSSLLQHFSQNQWNIACKYQTDYDRDMQKACILINL